MATLLKNFGGTMDSLLNLTPGERNRFRESNRGAVRETVSRINMISFASWKDNKHCDMRLMTCDLWPLDKHQSCGTL